MIKVVHVICRVLRHILFIIIFKKIPKTPNSSIFIIWMPFRNNINALQFNLSTIHSLNQNRIVIRILKVKMNLADCIILGRLFIILFKLQFVLR